MKMFISKLSKTDSDSKSAVIGNLCVRQMRVSDQTQKTDECRPSLKYYQVVKDTSQTIAVIKPS